jgi:hypothetical protein
LAVTETKCVLRDVRAGTADDVNHRVTCDEVYDISNLNHSTKDISMIMMDFNLLKPSGFFTYNQVQHSKILHGF